MDTGTHANAFGLVLATLLLNYGLSRNTIPWLERRVSREICQFAAGTLVFVLVWLVMGLLGLLPIIGTLVGWNWMPVALGQLSGDPLLTLTGIALAATVTVVTGVIGYRAATGVFGADTQVDLSSSRWLSALAAVYLGSFGLDVFRVAFESDGGGQAQFSLATVIGYVAIIGALWAAARYLRRRHLGPLPTDQLVHLGVLLTVGSIVGDTLTNGSLHLAQINYARLAGAIGATWPGLILILTTVTLGALLTWRARRLAPRLLHTMLRDAWLRFSASRTRSGR